MGRPPGGLLRAWPCTRSTWSQPAVLGLSGRAPEEARLALGALSEEERDGRMPSQEITTRKTVSHERQVMNTPKESPVCFVTGQEGFPEK